MTYFQFKFEIKEDTNSDKSNQIKDKISKLYVFMKLKMILNRCVHGIVASTSRLVAPETAYKTLSSLPAQTSSAKTGLLVQCTRNLSTSQTTRFPGEYEFQDPKSEDEVVNIKYVTKDGEVFNVRGKCGDNAMYLAHR